MAKIQCFNCKKEWELADSTTNRCPRCNWIVEIYYSQAEADRVSRIYNESQPDAEEAAGVCPLKGINGYAVSFPDQGHLAEIAHKLIHHDAP